MKSFNHNCPTQVIFGAGKLASIGKVIPAGKNKVLIASSKTAANKSGALDTIKHHLKPLNIEVHYKNIISPNPKLAEVDDISNFCRTHKIEVIIAVGGGSVIDAAKAVSLCVPSEFNAKELLKADISELKPIHLIAVPTTAGTGSEVSKGAIVTDIKNNWKGGIRGENIFPKVAILDPKLTESLPKSITLETGFDVVTHAFESLISKAATPITYMYSKAALETVIPALIDVANDTVTIETREKLMYSSLLAGYNLANASTCLPHRLQYPVGANTDSAHARGLAALYPAWFKSTYRFKPVEFNYIALIINRALKIDEIPNDEHMVISSLNNLLNKIEMSHKLRDFGTILDDCEKYTAQVDGNLALDPGCTKLETINQIYRESW